MPTESQPLLTRMIAVPVETHEALSRIADEKYRTVGKQATLVLDAFILKWNTSRQKQQSKAKGQ